MKRIAVPGRASPPPPAAEPGVWRRLGRSPAARISLAVIVFYLLLAAWGCSGWELPDWRTVNYARAYQGPSPAHPFGTDIHGRDVLAKTVIGARTALTVAFLASVLAVAIGLILGLLAGYLGGAVDGIITWVYSTLESVPYYLLILAFAFVLQDRSINLWGMEFRLEGINAVYLALGLTGWVGLCRLIRGEVIKRREGEYVLAARSLGASPLRVMFRHLAPNVLHVVIVTFTLGFVSYIHAEVVLSFLGLGAKEVPSWGVMIDESKLELARGVWWQLLAASLAIFGISLALHVFGDALRDALDPRTRGTKR